MFVNKVLQCGRYEQTAQAGSLVIVRRLNGSMPRRPPFDRLGRVNP